MNTDFVISRKLANQILQHTQFSPEIEVCGLLGGDKGRLLSYYPVVNVDTNPGNRFQMSDESQIAVLRVMRSKGESLVAIYHSHPHIPAVLSSLDVIYHQHPDLLYIVGSLATKGVLELRAFVMEDSGVPREVDLLMV